jgi:lysophospholipase L1-like esterase
LSVSASADLGGVYAAANAVTADNNKYWRTNIGTISGTNPAEFAVDCSSIPDNLKTDGMITFSGEPGNTAYQPNPAYNLPQDYTIDVNAAGFTGGVRPSTGWETLLTVTNNNRTTRSHYVGSWVGKKSIRMRVTRSTGGVSMRFDVANATEVSAACDGWAFMGDSITNKTMKANDCEEGGHAAYFGDMIRNYTGHIPTGECWGNSGWATQAYNGGNNGFLEHCNGTLSTWIDDSPLRYLWIALGTNDQAVGINQAQFQSNLTFFINRWLSTRSNGVVVLPSVLYRTDFSPPNPPGSSTYSGYITNVINSFNSPQVIAGPDLNTISVRLASIMFDSNDPIHPGIYGQAIYRTIVTDWIARVIYLGQAGSTWVCPVSL